MFFTNIHKLGDVCVFHALWYYITFPNAVELRLTKWLASVLLIDVHCALCGTFTFRYPLVRFVFIGRVAKKRISCILHEVVEFICALAALWSYCFWIFCFAVNATVFGFYEVWMNDVYAALIRRILLPDSGFLEFELWYGMLNLFDRIALKCRILCISLGCTFFGWMPLWAILFWIIDVTHFLSWCGINVISYMFYSNVKHQFLSGCESLTTFT